ncbi:hypothetical protein ACX0G9_22555 [Flavitalea flava]
MKRILLLLDGVHNSSHLLTSVLSIVQSDKSFVQVILLRRSYISNLIHPLTTDLSVMEKEQEKDRRLLEDNLVQIRHTFSGTGVSHSIEEGNFTLDEVLENTAFADVILADARISLSDLLYFPLNITFKDLLSDAHCPVLLLREDISQIERIILAYDGHFSCIYAFKLFCYLFPYWRSLPAYLVTIRTKENKEPDYQKHIGDWLSMHFDHIEVEGLTGKVSEELPGFVNRFGGSQILVMGAYGRTAVSRLFRQSLANTMLEKTTASLFNTHE